MENPAPQENTVGIPLTPTGIPSPFPYLNPESEEWKGADEEDESSDSGGNACVLREPKDPDDGGGYEDEPDEDESDDDNDNDRGFGFGIGLFLSAFNSPMPA